MLAGWGCLGGLGGRLRFPEEGGSPDTTGFLGWVADRLEIWQQGSGQLGSCGGARPAVCRCGLQCGCADRGAGWA